MDPLHSAAACGPLADLIGRRAADTVYLEDAAGSRAVTYRGLAVEADRWRAALAGTPAGARVLIDVADPLDFAVALLGVIAAGRCAVPVDASAPDAELGRIVALTEPVAALGDRPVHYAGLGLPVLVPGRPNTGNTTGPGAVLLLTSGSTGRPKAVRLTERQLLHVAGQVAAHNELTDTDRGFNALPLCHINAEVVGLLATLVAGATLVLDGRFRRNGFWALLRDRRITWVNAVPAMLAILAAEPVPAAHPGLRFVRSASAPLPVSVRDRIMAGTGVPVVESYGMTEAASQITATPLHGGAPAGSCGRPVGVDLQVRDSAGRPVAVGRAGRVWIRGDGVIDAYVAGRSADRFDAEGWLDTGDLGRTDAAGFLYLTGRADDVINRGGELVYPREVEETLLADPAARDAVVVGRPDPVLGAVPVAYVLPTDTALDETARTALVQRLHASCAEHLARFKRPADIHLVDDFPRAATGKVQRHRVRDVASVTR